MADSQPTPQPNYPQKIRFDADDPVVEAFAQQIEDMKTSMKAVLSQNEKLLKALGQQISPSVSSASAPTSASGPMPPGFAAWQAAQRPAAQAQPSEAPTEPIDQSSNPNRVRQVLGSIYRGTNRVIGAVGDTGPTRSVAEEEAEGTGSIGGGPPGKASKPSSGNPDDPAWLKMLRPQADQAITLPRYGEFTAQDVLNLGAHAAAKVAVPNQENALGKTVGTAGGALSAMASLTPYLHVMENKTGLNFAPNTMMQQGTQMGYSAGGANLSVGPFGMRIPGLGASTKETLREYTQAIGQGLNAGISIKDVRDLQNALRGEGYSGNRLSSATAAIANIKRDPNYGNIGSDETTAALYNSIMRQGNTSLDTFTKVLKGLGDAARASSLTVDQLKTSLSEFVDDQQNKGALAGHAAQVGTQFTNLTGQDPRILSQFQNSGVVQGLFSAQTGLLPSMMGASSLGTQMSSIYRAMDLMGGAFKNLPNRTMTTPYGNLTMSGQDQADAYAAQQLGVTPDVYKQMKRDRKKNEAGGYLETFASMYDEQADAIHKTRGNTPGAFSQLYRGGVRDSSGNAVPGMAKLDQMMKDAGFTSKEIQQVHSKHTWDQGNEIQRIMSSKTQKSRDDNTVTVQLAPELRGKFGLTTAANKKAANSAKVSVNGIYRESEPGVMSQFPMTHSVPSP